MEVEFSLGWPGGVGGGVRTKASGLLLETKRGVPEQGFGAGAREVAQGVRTLAGNPDDLGGVPRTHMVEPEN